MDKFIIHTADSAPEKSKGILKAVREKWGFIPNVVGEMAESPAFLKAYSDISAAASHGNFSPTELQIIQMSASSLNDCSYCIAAHTTLAEKDGVPRDVLEALRKDQPLKDKKLEALRIFTVSVMKKMGRTDERDLAEFYKAGYTRAHVLEVVLSLSLKIMTNYVNHIAKTPLDKPFEANRVEERSPARRSSNVA